MSNTCNAPGCRNDRRYRERFIVMPHVGELKFYGPRPDEYQKWQAKLEREGYVVSSSTKICSNHFRHGKPLEGNRLPTMHIRKYPEWAVPKKTAVQEASTSCDEIVCEVVAHMSQYLPPSIAQLIAKKYLKSEFPQDVAVDNLSHLIISLEKSQARILVEPVSAYVMPGKVVEAVAIYKNGIQFDNVRLISPLPSGSKRARHSVDSSKDVSDMCHPHTICDFHTYATSSTDETAPSAIHVEDCNIQNPPERKCSRPTCKNRTELLDKQLQELRSRVSKLEIENDFLKCENNSLNEQLDTSKQAACKLEDQVKQPRVSIDKIKDCDKHINLYTGLPTYGHFRWVFDEVKEAAEKMTYWKGTQSAEREPKSVQQQKRGPSRLLSLDNELLLTLMKLKLNLTEEFLAHLFNISFSLVSSIISTWIPLLANELSGLLHWPHKQEVSACYPECFKRWDKVTAILDCFEIQTEKPSHIQANSQIFSAYKNRPTVKFLLACTPGGSVSFISQPAGGNMSDKELVNLSGILDKFSPGDICMADKGFKICGELLERGVKLVLPPFVKGGKPFTAEENECNKAITHARIHVERVIGRVRDYAYLNCTVPLTQMDLIGPAAVVCCALTNLKTSVVPNK